MEEPWLTVRRYPPYITTKLVAAFIYKSLQLKKKTNQPKKPIMKSFNSTEYAVIDIFGTST